MGDGAATPPTISADAERVVARPARDFPTDAFANRHDRFKDVLVLPDEVFDGLYPDREVRTAYVEASAPGSTTTETLYAIRFDEGYEAERADDTHVAYLRLHLQEELGCDTTDPSYVDLRPLRVRESPPLTVTRVSTFRESTEETSVYVSPDRRESLGLEVGATVEVSNPETGGRILLELHESQSIGRDSVALSTEARQLLGVVTERQAEGDEDDADVTTVILREPAADDGGGPGRWTRLKRWVLRGAVGYNVVRLRVVIGLNADENRSAVRLDEETLKILGIEEGDRALVGYRGEEMGVRCLSVAEDSYLVTEDDDLEPGDVNTRTVLVPSTVRTAVGGEVDDVVRVRRDMWWIAGKQIVFSVFGILGVFLSGPTFISLAFPSMGPRGRLALLILFSLVALWLVLWPERQKCMD